MILMEAPRYIPNYTVADYQKWPGDWELWQGVPVSMSPAPSRHHQRLSGRLLRLFQEQLEANEDCHCETLHEVDWHITENTVVRPDLVIECEPNDEPHVVRPPALIVEILSPSSYSRDREKKYALYQDHGVKHYLIIDPDLNVLTPYTLQDGRYERIDPEDPLELHNGCAVRVNPDGLWAR